jgi:putative ABC transport system permease protein
VRMALGAERREIITMVVRRSLLLAAVGIAAGAALGVVSGRAVQSLLAGVTPGDPPTLVIAATMALAMTLAGSLRPAIRAARVDPITVMRAE